MKNLNYFIYLFILLNCLLSIMQCGDVKMVNVAVKNSATNNYILCYGQKLEESDLCGPGKYLCELIPGTTDIYSIVGIDFSRPSIPLNDMEYCYVEDINNFKNLTSMYVGSANNKMRTQGSTFSDMQKLPVKKATFHYVDYFTGNWNLTDSLEELYIDYGNGNIDVNLFQGNLKTLYINSFNGSLPQLQQENTYLETLKIVFTSNSSTNFPAAVSSSFSQYLTSLKNLDLYFYTSTSDIIDLNYTSLEKLQLGQRSTASTWTFPNSIYNLSTLKELSLNGNIFNFNDGVDFKILNRDFKLTVSGYTSFSTCQNCLLFPINTTLDITGNFQLASIDFSNVTNFSSVSNQFEQTLPDLTGLYSNIETFYLTDSDIYGEVSDDYCEITNDFSLNNNKLSIFPSCFKCDFNMRPKWITNPIYIETGSRDCSAFSIDTSLNGTIPTSGGSVTINGTGLGWEYIWNNEVYLLDIPNRQLTFSIPKGVGKDIQQGITFNGYDDQTITYSYTAPSITSQSVKSINEKMVFVVYGENLDYEGENLVTLYNTNTSKSVNYSFESQSDSLGFITSLEANVASDLVLNIKYELYVTVGGQKSNTLEFTNVYEESDSDSNSKTTSNSNTSEDEADSPSISSKLSIFLHLNIIFILFLLF